MNFDLVVSNVVNLKISWFHIRSLRVDLGICISFIWIQVLGCVMNYKSFRSVGIDTQSLFPKQKQNVMKLYNLANS